MNNMEILLILFCVLDLIVFFIFVSLFKINSKQNTMATGIAELKTQVADLNTKVDELQTSLDAEQQQLADLLALNAQVVTDLTAEKDRLQAIIDAGGVITPEDLAELSAGITTATDKLATTKADLEGTVAP